MRVAALLSKISSGLLLLLVLASPARALEQQTQVYKLHQNQPMVDTGLDFQPGDTIIIKQENNLSIYPVGRTVPWVSPTGDPGCVTSSDYLLSNVYCWSLVGRLGEDKPAFYVGHDFQITAPRSGRLYLAINNAGPNSNIGSGAWNIRVIRQFEPTPDTTPEPFLDLPWDYKSKGMSFGEAANKFNSVFDHQYPFLYSTRLQLEVAREFSTTTTSFKGERNRKINYPFHDGYDFGSVAETTNGEVLLAPADGCAIYKSNCETCGNAIHIDHQNHYQTRFYHMQYDGLVTTSTTQCTNVKQGDPIGKVGWTGNVRPLSEKGAHIHIMVVEDRNKDGQFWDNMPGGLTDPYGWQGDSEDPWPQYEFTYNGPRTGNDSHYLWIHPMPEKEAVIKPETPTTTKIEDYKVTTTKRIHDQDIKLNLTLSQIAKISENIISIFPTLEAKAHDLFGKSITKLLNPVTIELDLSDENLEIYKQDSLRIYSSQNGLDWFPEDTFIDWDSNRAIANIDHFTYFTLAGELRDINPPVTLALANGQALSNGDSLSLPVQLELVSTDNDSGVSGIAYTINENSFAWQTYTKPIEATVSGNYKIDFYAQDNAGNLEELKQIEFQLIDQPPEINISFDEKNSQISISTPPGSNFTETLEEVMSRKFKHRFTDQAGSWIEIIYSLLDTVNTDWIKIESLQRNNQEIFNFPKNKLYVKKRSAPKTDKKKLTQEWQLEKYKASANYNPIKNQTKLTVKDGQKTKQTLDGKILFTINTRENQLEITFQGL